MSIGHAWRKQRRTRRCRRLYGDACPHVEQHSRRVVRTRSVDWSWEDVDLRPRLR